MESLILVLVGCVHTPPHDPLPGDPAIGFERREQMPDDERYCTWEAESLRFGELALWVEEPPEMENWCDASADRARMVDILGRDGPFLSVRLTEWDCCPERAAVRCVTLDLRTGGPATLAAYDERHAEKRWAAALEKVPAGYDLLPEAFVVGDRHVSFCAVRGEDVVLISVR